MGETYPEATTMKAPELHYSHRTIQGMSVCTVSVYGFVVMHFLSVSLNLFATPKCAFHGDTFGQGARFYARPDCSSVDVLTFYVNYVKAMLTRKSLCALTNQLINSYVISLEY